MRKITDESAIAAEREKKKERTEMVSFRRWPLDPAVGELPERIDRAGSHRTYAGARARGLRRPGALQSFGPSKRCLSRQPRTCVSLVRVPNRPAARNAVAVVEQLA